MTTLKATSRRVAMNSTLSDFSFRATTAPDRKSTRLNSSHTEIYTLSLHDALPIYRRRGAVDHDDAQGDQQEGRNEQHSVRFQFSRHYSSRSEEHTSELQSHRDLHSFPTRRSSDLQAPRRCRP